MYITKHKLSEYFGQPLFKAIQIFLTRIIYNIEISKKYFIEYKLAAVLVS